MESSATSRHILACCILAVKLRSTFLMLMSDGRTLQNTLTFMSANKGNDALKLKELRCVRLVGACYHKSSTSSTDKLKQGLFKTVMISVLLAQSRCEDPSGCMAVDFLLAIHTFS